MCVSGEGGLPRREVDISLPPAGERGPEERTLEPQSGVGSISCAARVLDMSSNLSEPQFPYLHCQGNNTMLVRNPGVTRRLQSPPLDAALFVWVSVSSISWVQ